MKKFLWIFLLASLFALIQEINTDDETWFLQVLHRFLSGETLYKEIFLGVGPLSVYISALPMLFFGHELFVARLVLALYFTLGIYLMLLIMQELKIERFGTLPFFLACFVFAHPQSNWGFSPYNLLAKVLLLATFWTALKWNDSFERKWLIRSACAAALCFAAKQNVGAIAVVCVAVNCFFHRRKTWLSDMSLCAATFFFLLALLFLPIFLRKGLSSFLHYGIFHKTLYLTFRDHSYFPSLKDWSLYSLFIYLAPFLLALGALFSFRQKQMHWQTLLIFLTGSALVLFPRPDNVQKVTFIPFALLGILYFYSFFEMQIASQIKFFMKGGLTLLFSWVLFLPLKGTFEGLFRGDLVFSSVPKFRWIVMQTPCHDHWHRMKREFSFPEKKLFFLSTHAGFYYLLFDRQNPTPFDLPHHPALGRHGEEKIMRLLKKSTYLARDHLSWSNWPFLHPDFRPRKLERFIGANMEPIAVQEGFKTIFEIFVSKDSDERERA